MKPTIEEVKEYFKDALEVECANNGKKQKLTKDFAIDLTHGDGSLGTYDTYDLKGVWLYSYCPFRKIGTLAKITKRRDTSSVTVPKQFVLDAHESACSQWREKIEKQLPDLFPSFSVKIGDRFECDGDEFILSRVDINERINLINLKTGVPFDNALKVKNDNLITKEEFKKLCDGYKFNKTS
jgi:hypothetical protein